jgi:hypothetical protein
MKIRAKKNLYSFGLCFKKGEEYEIPDQGTVLSLPGLMDVRVINRLGQPHIIGSWWRHFELVGW